MKLTTALYMAAFVLTPAVGFAADQSARQQDSTTASDRSYPYPDWPAIAKTAPQERVNRKKAPISRKPSSRVVRAVTRLNPAFWRRPGVHLKPFRALAANCGKLVSTRTGWVKAKANAGNFAPPAARIGFPVPRP